MLVIALAIIQFFHVIPAQAQQTFILSDEDQWEPQIEVDAGSPAGQLSMAREALANGEIDRAINLASGWLDRYPRHDLAPEAYLVRGDALMARKDYYEALFDYEYIARAYTGSEAFLIALQREIEIASLYANGLKRKLWGIRLFSAEDEAEELLIRVQERVPGSRVAEDAGIELADYYFRKRKMDLAAEAYALFIENYPNSNRISKARRRLIYANLSKFKGPAYSPVGLYEARSLLRNLKIVEPTTSERIGADALLVRIDETDAEKLLVTAQWYAKTKDYISAEFTIRRLLRTYPQAQATQRGIALAADILPNLPPATIEQAPDYAGLARTLSEPDTLPATAVETQNLRYRGEERAPLTEPAS